MRTWTQLELAWELDRAGVKVPVIAQRLGKHRATFYLCLKGIKQGGCGSMFGGITTRGEGHADVR